MYLFRKRIEEFKKVKKKINSIVIECKIISSHKNKFNLFANDIRCNDSNRQQFNFK